MHKISKTVFFAQKPVSFAGLDLARAETLITSEKLEPKAGLESKMCSTELKRKVFLCLGFTPLGCWSYFLGPHCLTSDLVSWFQTSSQAASDDADEGDATTRAASTSSVVTSLSSQPIPDVLKWAHSTQLNRRPVATIPARVRTSH